MSDRQAILEWVNTTLRSEFRDVAHIPAKAVAKILHAMFGEDRCPLHDIMFSDDSTAAQLRNATRVLEMARRCGYNGVLEASKWAQHTDFISTLVLWRWIKASNATHPFPSNYDFSLDLRGSAAPKRPRVEPEKLTAKHTLIVVHSNERAAQETVKAVQELEESKKRLQDVLGGRPSDSDDASATASVQETCSSCHSHIQRRLAHNLERIRRLEAARAKILAAAKSKDITRLFEALDGAY